MSLSYDDLMGMVQQIAYYKDVARLFAKNIRAKEATLKAECWHPDADRIVTIEPYEYEPTGGHGLSMRKGTRKTTKCAFCDKSLSTIYDMEQ